MALTLTHVRPSSTYQSFSSAWGTVQPNNFWRSFAVLHVQRSTPEKKTLFGIYATCSLVTTRSDQPSSSPDNRSHSPSSEDPYWRNIVRLECPYTTPFEQVTSLALSPKSLVFAEFANARTDTTETTPSVLRTFVRIHYSRFPATPKTSSRATSRIVPLFADCLPDSPFSAAKGIRIHGLERVRCIHSSASIIKANPRDPCC